MGHRQTLTTQQQDVLRWIADGCPDGVMEDYSHRVSAAALRRRGLVETSGRGPTWRAKITEAGSDYLERAASAAPPIPRQPNRSVTQELVDEVIAAGGSRRYPRKRYYEQGGVDYERRAELAEAYGKVPDGKQLRVTPASDDEVQIDLVDAPKTLSAPLKEVAVPEKVSRYHPTVARFRRATHRHEVSRAALPRASRILQALVVEAETRGFEVEMAPELEGRRQGRSGWSGPTDGHVVVTVDGCATAIRLSEEGLSSRAYWEDRNRRWAGDRWALPPLAEYEVKATGRLELALVSGYSSRKSSWADRKAWSLEDKLPEVLAELETRADDQRKREEQARHAADNRQREWEAAMEQAKVRYIEHQRREALLDEAQRRREAEAIRVYCDQAQELHNDHEQAREWIAWARRHADSIDPLQQPPRMPPIPDSIDVHELQPFLDGWSAYGPERRGR